MHSRLCGRWLPGIVACLLSAAGAFSDSVYNEAVSGDLSNSGLSPTVLPIGVGSNRILGTTGRTTAIDRDYFTVTVPQGWEISSLMELAGTNVGGAVSFIGLQSGNRVTISTAATTADGLLGWTHYGPTSTDIDILPDMGVASLGSTGFTGPLPSGTYSLWIQDFNAGTFSYGFDIQVTATPEPGTYTTFLMALGSLVMLARRRKRS